MQVTNPVSLTQRGSEAMSYRWTHKRLVRSNGEDVESGDVFEPTEDELAAFGDRLEPVESESVDSADFDVDEGQSSELSEESTEGQTESAASDYDEMGYRELQKAAGEHPDVNGRQTEEDLRNALKEAEE